MATYYVKTTGNNASAGTSPATAWQTINYALGATSGIAAGDTLYVAVGVYREVISVGMTTSPSTTTIIGDTDGSIFSTSAGEVRITSRTTNDDTAGSASDTLGIASKSYMTFRKLRIESGTGYGARANGCTNITFDKCHISTTGSSAALRFDATAGVTTNNVCENSILIGRANVLQIVGSATAGAVNMGVTIRNTLVMASSSACIFLNSTGTTGTLSGVTVTNCTTIGGATGMQINTSVYDSTTGSLTIKNCLLCCHGTAMSANVSGQIVEDYNRLACYGTARNNVPTTGANTIVDGNIGIDLGAGFLTGSSRHLFTQPYLSGIVNGDGTATGAPSTDIYGYTRPSPPSIGVAENNPVSASSGVAVAPRYTINAGIN